MDLLVYIIYRTFSFILNITPKFMMIPVLKFWSKLAYIINTKHRNIAYKNLNFAFGNSITQEEKKEIVKSSYENLVFTLYEFVMTQQSSHEEITQKVNVVNEEYILDAINNDEKIILVTAHYGNWELAIPYLSLNYRPISVISKPIKNKYLDKLFRKARAKNLVEMFEKHGAAKRIVKALRDKRIVAMAIDQSISRNKASVVRFFNHNVTQTDSPVRFASKLNATIIPVLFERDDLKHTAYFSKPIKIPKDSTEEELVEYSQLISDVFEKQIKKKPSDWFWQHKRFKEFNKEIYDK